MIPRSSVVIIRRVPIAQFSMPMLSAVKDIAANLMKSSDLQKSSMCHLLTALAAFNNATHSAIIDSGLVPQLVSVCQSTKVTMPATGLTVRTILCFHE